MNAVSDFDKAIEQKKLLPNVGYVLATSAFMQDYSDVLFDNFTVVKERTTWEDELLERHRFVLQSPHFTSGWGQYEIRFKTDNAGEVSILDVTLVK